MKISVIIPAYNSSKTICELHERLLFVLIKICSEFEIIIVDDGSQDDTWTRIRDLSSKNSRVKGIKLTRNFGQHNAILCGIRAAKFDVIVTLDDDLQNPPEEIPRLLESIREGYDVVYGYPVKQQHGFIRNLLSKITKLFLCEIIGSPIAKNISSYRAFRMEIRSSFADYKSPNVNIDVLLAWSTEKFWAIEVDHLDREGGISGYSYKKLVRHAFNMITGFSTLPLKVASALGFTLSAFGVGTLLYVFTRYFLEGGSVPGFPFLASLICIFSGAQLLVLGVIGEYIARIYLRAMEHPQYLVGTTA